MATATTKKPARKPAKAAKPKATAKSVDGATARPKPARATILGKPASPVLRWMSKNGYTLEEARKVVAKLAQGGELKPSTLTTCLSDGRGGQQGEPAKLTREEIGGKRRRGTRPACSRIADQDVSPSAGASGYHSQAWRRKEKSRYSRGS